MTPYSSDFSHAAATSHLLVLLSVPSFTWTVVPKNLFFLVATRAVFGGTYVHRLRRGDCHDCSVRIDRWTFAQLALLREIFLCQNWKAQEQLPARAVRGSYLDRPTIDMTKSWVNSSAIND
jgi:hypothetical protein